MDKIDQSIRDAVTMENPGKQETIIAIVDSGVTNRDPSRDVGGGKWGNGTVHILSNSEHDQVVVTVNIPGTDKAHELVFDKALLKTYIREIR